MGQAKTKWARSQETETERMIGVLAGIYQRFYLVNNFLVLPRLLPGSVGSVYLPKPGVSFTRKEIEQLKRVDIKKFPPLTVAEPIRKKIAESLPSDSEGKESAKLREAWQKVEKSFWEKVFLLFPILAKSTINLEIRPTKFGTCSSFNLPKISKRIEIFVYIREDMEVGNIAEAILSALFKKDCFEQKFDWGQTEAVVDFILKRTALAGVFPAYRPTIGTIKDKQNGKLIAESLAYQKELGTEIGHIFEEEGGEVLISKQTVATLSPLEKRVLTLLIRKKNSICRFDEIAAAMWQDMADEKFSFWAIAKVIWRLRRKLEGLGVTGTVIKAWRKEGYLLLD
ncbi:helix-turn-helix domain-containing protein [Candidatus Shapirobacteria bacterium]|nr:helix-turn-helix domain-containing protein [Candidatus Shapirobacteria bacterium]